MPAIIRYPFRSDNAYEYFVRYGNNATTEHVYIAIGKTTPWANELTPPAPLDSENDEIQTWNDMIAAKLVQTNDITLAAPRVDWVSGTEYFTVDPALEDPFINPCYVINSQNQIFLCVGKTATAGTPSTVEPTFTPTATSAKPVDITTADGYTWRFLYDLSFYDAANLMNSVWMPVPAAHKATTNQTQYGFLDAYKILRARWVMFRTRFLDTDLPTTLSYRQISLVHNPQLVGGAAATGSLYSQTTAGGNTTPPQAWSNTNIDIQYTENHQPIYRAVGQFEEIKIVLEF